MSASMAGSPVRVLMVLTVRYAKNGITGSVINYVSRLDPARVRCDLVSPNEPDAQGRAAIERTGGTIFVLHGRNRNPVSYLRALAGIIRSREIEVLHAHGNSATLYLEMRAGQIGGAKVRIPHSHNTTCRMKLADRLLRGVFYRNFTDAFACSQAAGKWLFPRYPFTVLNNAVETDRFCFDPAVRNEARTALGLKEDAFALLHIGAFNAQKNQTYLIGAFAQLQKLNRNAVLLLAGDGGNRGSCEALAARLGLAERVRFLGWREDVPALLFAADVFVLPSLHEGLPLTLVEAQCAGLNCIASDRVTREAALTGLVSFCSINTEEAFATAIAQTKEQERITASTKAIARVKEAGFDVRSNVERLMLTYETLVNLE